LRLSAVALCVSGCFFGLGLDFCCGLRLLYGRVATFHVDSMLTALSVIVGYGRVGFRAGWVSGGFGFAWIWFSDWEGLGLLFGLHFFLVSGGGASNREESSIKRKAEPPQNTTSKSN